MCEELKLTVLEKEALDKGDAPRKVRLKCGRIVWDEIEKDLPPLTGESQIDVDRFLIFKREVDKQPSSHRAALKEWLEVQIECGYADVLDSDVEQGKVIETYKKHLEVISAE